MNIPPPPKTLPMKVETGDPVLVRVEHQGQKYILRITHTVLAVWPAGGPPDPQGNPQFNVQVAPVMTVTKEENKKS